MELEVQEDFNQLPYEFDVTCDNCGTKFKTTKQRYLKNKNNFCSRTCMGLFNKAQPNCECAVCHKPLHKKQSWIKKTKNITCSYECCYKLKMITMKGENNHQYGIRGQNNSSYKDGTYINSYGYRNVMMPDHPFCGSNGYILEHILVAEQYLLDETNSIYRDGKRYLSREYVIHHIDFNRLNNNIDNLCILEKNIHVSYHNSLHKLIKDEYGKIKEIKFKHQDMTPQQLRQSLLQFIKDKQCYYKMMSTTLSERGEGGFGSTGK